MSNKIHFRTVATRHIKIILLECQTYVNYIILLIFLKNLMNSYRKTVLIFFFSQQKKRQSLGWRLLSPRERSTTMSQIPKPRKSSGNPSLMLLPKVWHLERQYSLMICPNTQVCKQSLDELKIYDDWVVMSIFRHY